MDIFLLALDQFFFIDVNIIFSDVVIAQPVIISSSLPEILVAYVNLLQSSLLQGATLTAALNFIQAVVQAEIPQKPSFEVF